MEGKIHIPLFISACTQRKRSYRSLLYALFHATTARLRQHDDHMSIRKKTENLFWQMMSTYITKFTGKAGEMFGIACAVTDKPLVIPGCRDSVDTVCKIATLSPGKEAKRSLSSKPVKCTDIGNDSAIDIA